MTNKDAISNIAMIRAAYIEPVTELQRKIIDDTFDMAIKALEQEPILDKIRAEIIQSIQNGVLKIENGNEALFNILDKYKAESEE